MTFLESAIKYLSQGFHPIPCHPKSKIAAVEWRDYQENAPEIEQVTKWWRDVPDANIALVMGRGVAVIDLDGGDDAEKMLLKRGITFDGFSPRVVTANGYHVYCSVDGYVKSRNGFLTTDGGKPQIDIKADGGYVLAPPSIHPSGKIYEWEVPLTFPIIDMPEKLFNLVQSEGKKREVNEPGWVGKALSGVSEGSRDDTCAKLAGFFLGLGISSDVVSAILINGFAKNCNPKYSTEDVYKTIRSIETKHNAGLKNKPLPKLSHVSSVLDDLSESIKEGPKKVVKTPFPSLNKFLSGGFSPGELIYLGARPGVGKTSMGLAMARGAAKRESKVLFISREMVNVGLARRLVSQEGRISASSLKSCRMDSFENQKMLDAVYKLKQLNIWLTDSIYSIEDIIDVMNAENGLVFDFLIIDYLQLIRAPRKIQDRRLQIEYVSQSLKALAMEKQIPIMCLSSLSRSPDKTEKTPTLASLRESGELEHDADVVILLHRKVMESETECMVAKNRDGRVGIAELYFRGEFVNFDELTEQEVTVSQ